MCRVKRGTLRSGGVFLLYRMKVLVIVWGTSNRGMSQSIKQLALSFPFSSIIRPWDSDNYDSYEIGAVKDSCGKDRIVGIESLEIRGRFFDPLLN